MNGVITPINGLINWVTGAMAITLLIGATPLRTGMGLSCMEVIIFFQWWPV